MARVTPYKHVSGLAGNPYWQPGKRRQLGLKRKWAWRLEQEQLKASLRSKAHKKVRYKGLAKHEAQLLSQFGLANARGAS